MGRGYSVTRSTSKRPTNKTKRERSVSLGRVKAQVSRLAESMEAAETPEEKKKALEAFRADDDDDDEFGPSEDEDECVARPDVLTKYKICGKMTDEVLDLVCSKCVAGAGTRALCSLGDTEMATRCRGIFQKSKDETGARMKKGVSLPTTVCVNNVLCNHTPFNEAEQVVLKDGDVVKVHLSIHLDGYPCTAGRTLVVGEHGAEHLNTAAANAIAGTYTAMMGMLRLMKPGAENGNITDFIHHVARSYGVQPIEGVLSNRTKRWVLDGMDAIITRRVTREDPQQDVADVMLGPNQVWTLDVAFTSAESYKMKLLDETPNLHRRNEITIPTRLTAATATLEEVRDKAGCFAFTPNQLEKPLRARLGMTELRKLGMVDDMLPLGCKRGTGITARFSCTVVVMEKRVHVLAGLPKLDAAVLDVSNVDVPADIAEIAAAPLVPAKEKKKPAKAEGVAAEPEDEDVGPRKRKTRRLE